ncbi:MAG TPA: DegV family protein [Candidatus Dormibacteraeota bacterium]|nr:DegV family protein [Candidatus Dormibacteraeota bacterium]
MDDPKELSAPSSNGGRPPVRVVTDSSTCIEPELAERLGIDLVSLHVHLNGRDLLDLKDVRPGEVYRALRDGAEITTSAASVGDYLESFQRLPGPVFCPTMAASMTSMYEAATLAARLAEDAEIRVLDTGTAAGGLRLIALASADMARRGLGLDEIEAAASEIGRRIEVVGMLDTIDYLARSGRVPQVAAWGSSVLKVRPVVRFASGSGNLLTLVRGNGWALRELEKLVRDSARRQSAGASGEGLVCTVFHADATELAGELQARLEQRLPQAKLTVSEFTPAMGVHTGPGLVGYALYVEPEALSSQESRNPSTSPS